MLVSQECQVMRHQDGGEIRASFGVSRHRCEAYPFCDVIFRRNSEMDLFAGI